MKERQHAIERKRKTNKDTCKRDDKSKKRGTAMDIKIKQYIGNLTST